MLDILVADEESHSRLGIASLLGAAGHRVAEATDGAEALRLVSDRSFDVLISDVRLPRIDGLALLRQVRQASPSTVVILMTAIGRVADAMSALRLGAYDYVTKPFDLESFPVPMINLIAERRALEGDFRLARGELDGNLEAAIVGRSPVMMNLLQRIETLAQSDAPVLISGESGTGKELIANALHLRSARRQQPFVAVNCAALPETLLEAELFGHERGAFTGAARKRDGRFKLADGGTLLLDEVGEIPLAAQTKLLRVVQEGTIEPLGTGRPLRVDVRVISATHQNLKARVADGRFREDLYYRLNVLDVQIPPLRARRGDLALLFEHFARRFRLPGAPPVRIAPRAWRKLEAYSFPGNVRELAHAVERALVLARGDEIDLEHLPVDICGVITPELDSQGDFRPLAIAASEFERKYLLAALNLSGGRRGGAAELLGISRKNLWEKLRGHEITDGELDDFSEPLVLVDPSAKP